MAHKKGEGSVKKRTWLTKQKIRCKNIRRPGCCCRQYHRSPARYYLPSR